MDYPSQRTATSLHGSGFDVCMFLVFHECIEVRIERIPDFLNEGLAERRLSVGLTLVVGHVHEILPLHDLVWAGVRGFHLYRIVLCAMRRPPLATRPGT